MNPPPPAAVLFDFGGTLDSDGLPWVVRFHSAYHAQHGSLHADHFAAVFSASDAALAESDAIRTAGFRAMLALQADLLRPMLPDGNRIDPAQLAEDVYQDALPIIMRNRILLARLHQTSLIGIVSNFTGNLQLCLAELQLLDSIDVVSDSTAVGVAKPDARIFEITLDALGVAPARAWMVGDNPYADVRAATAAGLSTVWLAPPEREVPEGCQPTARIGRLPELLSVPGLLHTNDDRVAPETGTTTAGTTRHLLSCTA